MISLLRPDEAAIRSYLEQQGELPLSYAAAGCTRDQAPAGFVDDHERVFLGHGETIFHQARAAIERWQMFPQQMAGLYWPTTPIEPGRVVGVLFHAKLFWSLNPCRIVYTIDRQGDVEQFGFAYGTLPGHIERGEERFLVEWRRADNTVWYDLRAHSRPAHPLAWIGQPVVRMQQARFRRLSCAAMQAAVSRPSHSSVVSQAEASRAAAPLPESTIS